MYRELLGLDSDDYEAMIMARVRFGLCDSEEEAVRYYFNEGRKAVLEKYDRDIEENL